MIISRTYLQKVFVCPRSTWNWEEVFPEEDIPIEKLINIDFPEPYRLTIFQLIEFWLKWTHNHALVSQFMLGFIESQPSNNSEIKFLIAEAKSTTDRYKITSNIVVILKRYPHLIRKLHTALKEVYFKLPDAVI